MRKCRHWSITYIQKKMMTEPRRPSARMCSKEYEKKSHSCSVSVSTRKSNQRRKGHTDRRGCAHQYKSSYITVAFSPRVPNREKCPAQRATFHRIAQQPEPKESTDVRVLVAACYMYLRLASEKPSSQRDERELGRCAAAGILHIYHCPGPRHHDA